MSQQYLEVLRTKICGHREAILGSNDQLDTGIPVARNNFMNCAREGQVG